MKKDIPKQSIRWQDLIVTGVDSDEARQIALLLAFLAPNAKVTLPNGEPVTDAKAISWLGTEALVLAPSPHGANERGDWRGPNETVHPDDEAFRNEPAVVHGGAR